MTVYAYDKYEASTLRLSMTDEQLASFETTNSQEMFGVCDAIARAYDAQLTLYLEDGETDLDLRISFNPPSSWNLPEAIKAVHLTLTNGVDAALQTIFILFMSFDYLDASDQISNFSCTDVLGTGLIQFAILGKLENVIHREPGSLPIYRLNYRPNPDYSLDGTLCNMIKAGYMNLLDAD